MSTQQAILQLKAFAEDLSGWSFERLSALEGSRGAHFREVELEGGDTLQLEAECLQRFSEGERGVLHIPAIATLGHVQFSIELFVEDSGKVRWDGNVYEFVNGVPQVAWSNSAAADSSNEK